MLNFDKASKVGRKFGFQIALLSLILLMTAHFLLIWAIFLELVCKINVIPNKLHAQMLRKELYRDL